MEPKEEVGGGIFTAIFVVFFLLLLIFLRTPASHYLGKWNAYWEDKDKEESREQISHDITLEEQEENYRHQNARKDCGKRAMKFFRVSDLQLISGFASSTNGGDYKTYDCLATKWTKV